MRSLERVRNLIVGKPVDHLNLDPGLMPEWLKKLVRPVEEFASINPRSLCGGLVVQVEHVVDGRGKRAQASLHVLDPLELDFDLDHAGIWVDAESGARQHLDAPAVRAGYLKRLRQFCAGLDEQFRSVGGDFVQLRTDQPPIAALAGYLASRKERTR